MPIRAETAVFDLRIGYDCRFIYIVQFPVREFWGNNRSSEIENDGGQCRGTLPAFSMPGQGGGLGFFLAVLTGFPLLMVHAGAIA